jgi:hypothetical protein
LNIAHAQEQMRHAWFGGAPGMIVSAAVWAAAGAVASGGGVDFPHAVWTLFIGGMAIHPLGMLLTKLLGRPGGAKGNPLERLALETTFTMILALPLAYAVAQFRPAWFFPAMMLVIGGRYAVFATIYGLRIYWMLGAVLALAAYGAAVAGFAPAASAFAGAAIEAAFALVLFLRLRGAAAPEGLATSP